MKRRQIVKIAMGIGVLGAIAGGSLLAINAGQSQSQAEPVPLPKTATVQRQTVRLTEELDGMLGFADKYTVVSLTSGVVTELPEVGDTIDFGEALMELDGSRPVVMLQGDVPAWRAFTSSMSDGSDVEQLEASLKALGLAPSDITVDEHWDDRTTDAVEAWQKSLELDETGRIANGAIVFQPAPIRVESVKAILGAPSNVGSPVLIATSTRPEVTVELEADRQTIVAVGAAVTVGLPDGTEIAGKVTEIGTVATLPLKAGQPDPAGTPTVTVTVELDSRPKTGLLDGAPVTVEVVRESHADVLLVPVDALLALESGDFAVEVLGDDGQTTLVTVKLGFFDEHLVEVSAAGLEDGMKVVVPS